MPRNTPANNTFTKRDLGFFLVILFSLGFIKSSFSQNFYDQTKIQKIEISFSQANWDYILDTAKLGSDSYTLSQWVRINGVQFDSAGVKYKGNSSFNPNNAKNPFHIELDHFKNQNYLGFKDIKLSNGFNDPSFLREAILYSMFQNYAKAPRANFAQVFVNGTYRGVYTNVEAITKTFLNDRFYSKDNTFVFADFGGCDLRYKGPDTMLYKTPYTMKSDYGLEDLKNLCLSLKDSVAFIENRLDVDRTLWLHAFTNAFVILDSYIGSSKHNYYIYEDHNSRFNPIIWDLNGGIGVFSFAYPGQQLNIPQMQNLNPMLHVNDSMWPLINKLLTVPMYKRMYIAHMKTIVNENLNNGSYMVLAQSMHTLIDSSVLADSIKFGTYTQFKNNITTNILLGPKTIPGISFMMDARKNYLNSTPEFQQIAPAISNVQASISSPPINTNFFITARTTTANSVFIGYRYSKLERFRRYAMFDDGLHGDGLAGDGIFGVQVAMSSNKMQYYIYAENNNAGIFSPQRAEHEFYTLKANYTGVIKGELVINELMALNTKTVLSPKGLYSDWIELYNNSNRTLSLDYLNLTDDPSNLTKWQLPLGKSLQAFKYQIIWADEDSSATGIHAKFKLSGSGEKLILSYPNGTIIDSITFSTQSNDISFARYPNGTGPFVFLPPTFNAVNAYLGTSESNKEIGFVVYPNPVQNTLNIDFKEEGMHFKIYNLLGSVVMEKTNNSISESIQMNLNNGVYFIKVYNKNKSSMKKFMVVN